MASLIREITALIKDLLKDVEGVYLLRHRLKTLKLLLQGISDKINQFNMATMPADLLLRLEARLYEFRPILRHLQFNKEGDEIEKIQMAAHSRDEIGSFDAAMGRLSLDINFLGVQDERDPLNKYLTEKRRKLDTEKDAKQMVKFLRTIFAYQKELPGITPHQQTLAKQLKDEMIENEVIMYKPAEYLGKIDGKLKQLAKATIDIMDENVFDKEVTTLSRSNSPRALYPEKETYGASTRTMKASELKKLTFSLQRQGKTEDKKLNVLQSKYHLGSGSDKVIAYGTFGPVIESIYKKEKVVLRPLPRKELLSLRARVELRERLLTWRSELTHGNIVQLRTVLLQTMQWYLVLEGCHSTLFDTLHTPPEGETSLKVGLQPDQRNIIFRGIASGLSFLHSKNILHQNLKPDNVMLLKREPYVKLTNFGMAILREELEKVSQSQAPSGFKTLRDMNKEINPDNYHESDQRKQFLPYQAPEIFESWSNWTPFSDVYSFAVIVWECTQVNKFPYAEFRNLRKMVVEKHIRPSWYEGDPANHSNDDPTSEEVMEKEKSKKQSRIYRKRAHVLPVKKIKSNDEVLFGKSRVGRRRSVFSFSRRSTIGSSKDKAEVKSMLRPSISFGQDTSFGKGDIIPEWIIDLGERCWKTTPQRRPRSYEVFNLIEGILRVIEKKKASSLLADATPASPETQPVVKRPSTVSYISSVKKPYAAMLQVVGRAKKEESQLSIWRGHSKATTKKTVASVAENQHEKEEDRLLLNLKGWKLIEEIEGAHSNQEESHLQEKLDALLALFKTDAKERKTMSNYLKYKAQSGTSSEISVTEHDSKKAFIELLTLIMDTFPWNRKIQGSCICLLRLAVQNEQDVELCGTLGVGLSVCDAMAGHPNDKLVQLFGILILGNLALGSYPMRKQLIKDGAAKYILTAMENYKDTELIQRYSNWTIANFLREKEANLMRKQAKQLQRPARKNTERDRESSKELNVEELKIAEKKQAVLREQNQADRQLIIKKAFVNSRVVQLISMSLRNFEKEVDIHVYACGALLNLINTDVAITRELYESKLHLLIMNRMSAFSMASKMQEYGVSLLGKFLVQGTYTDQLLKDDVLKSIIDAMGSNPYNTRIRYAAWKCLEILSSNSNTVQGIMKVITKSIEQVATVVICCMFLKYVADSVRVSNTNPDFSAFIDSGVVSLLLSKVIPMHIKVKQVVLEALLALQSIVGSQTVIRLSLLVDFETVGLEDPETIPEIENKLELVETKTVREFIADSGIEMLKKLLKLYKGHVAVVEGCLGIMENVVNTGVDSKFDLLRFDELSNRNALQKLDTGTEVMVAIVNGNSNPSMMTKGLSILCELAKWEELGHRQKLLHAILNSDISSVDTRNNEAFDHNVNPEDIQRENFGAIEALERQKKKKSSIRAIGMGIGMNRNLGTPMPAYSAEDEATKSELIAIGILNVIDEAIRNYNSNTIVQEIALETLVYLCHSEYGRAKVLECGAIEMVQSITESFAQFPTVLTMAFLLIERLVCCKSCRKEHEEYTEVHKNKRKKRPVLFIWDDESECVGFSCKRQCGSFADLKFIQLIVDEMLNYQSEVMLLKAGSLALRAFSLGSSTGLQYVRDVVCANGQVRAYLPWLYDDRFDGLENLISSKRKSNPLKSLIGDRISMSLSEFSLSKARKSLGASLRRKKGKASGP